MDYSSTEGHMVLQDFRGTLVLGWWSQSVDLRILCETVSLDEGEGWLPAAGAGTGDEHKVRVTIASYELQPWAAR